MKLLTIDIETSPYLSWHWGLYNQNFQPVQIVKKPEILCFAAKFLDDKHTYYASIHDLGRTEMLKLAHELLSQADVVLHYNGERFDIRRLNTEFLRLGLFEPAPSQHIDLLKVVRKRFDLPYNRLDEVLKELGLGGKIKHEGWPLWFKFMEGDEKAYQTMKRYNIADVTKLEKAYKKIRGWIKAHPNASLFDGNGCPNCGSAKLQRRGFRTTVTGAYQRYFCSNCGAWPSDTKRAHGVGIRGS